MSLALTKGYTTCFYSSSNYVHPPVQRFLHDLGSLVANGLSCWLPKIAVNKEITRSAEADDGLTPSGRLILLLFSNYSPFPTVAIILNIIPA